MPGLAAKPIIDILPVVKDILLVNNQAMEDLDYEAKGEFGIPFRRYFQKGKEIRTHNVHVFEQGSTEIDRHLKFRDWMRKYPDDLNSYAKIKIELAEKFPSDIRAYCLGKEDFINNIDIQTGWNGFQFVNAATPQEWEHYHRIKKIQIFDPLNIVYDSNHPTITANNCFHFVLLKNSNIVSVVMVEFLNQKEASIRSLATDEQEKTVIKLHANPDAESFYRKLGYIDMKFDDISVSEDTIDLGKNI